MKTNIIYLITVVSAFMGAFLFMDDRHLHVAAAESMERSIERIDLQRRQTYNTLRMGQLRSDIIKMKSMQAEPEDIEIIKDEMDLLRSEQKSINNMLLDN